MHLRVLTKEVYACFHSCLTPVWVVRRKPKLCFKRQMPSSYLFFSVLSPRLFLCLHSKLFWPKITSLSDRLSSKNKVPPAMKIRPHFCITFMPKLITQRKKQRKNKQACAQTHKHTLTSHHGGCNDKEEANPEVVSAW